MKIMTFNLRCDVKADGINAFGGRKELVKQCISEISPDLIGFQEVVESSRRFLKENLDSYTFLGCGRMKNYGGEGVSIAYKSGDFELVRYETFWLSESPLVPESKFSTDQSSCPRTCIAAKLADKEGKIHNFYNTHLDHMGTLARLSGAIQIVQHMSTFCGKDEPVYLTGDMNALPDENSVAVFEAAGLVDATKGLGGTFHKFGKYFPENTPDGSDKTIKIDYIYTNTSCDFKSRIVDEYEKDGVYVSDHYPIVSEL